MKQDHVSSQQNRPIRVGIVGYGSATRVFHAPLITTLPGLQLQAMSSSNPSKVRADFPDIAVETSADALIARDDIDLIVLPTPNATHFPLARAALQHGKHVVVDKPFTLALAQAEELAALAQTQNRLLAVFHNRRWDSDFLAVQALIDSGQLGKIVSYESTFHYFRPKTQDRWRERAEEGGGLWNDLGPHLVDQALQLFGLPEAVYLDSDILREGGQTDDYFTAILRYPDKRAILRVNASAGLAAPRFIVQGSTASFTKGGMDPQEDALKAGQRPGVEGTVWGKDSLDGILTQHADRSTSVYPTPLGNYPAFYASVRDALFSARQNTDAAPVSAVDLPGALAVMAVLDLGRLSAASRAEQPFTFQADSTLPRFHRALHS